MADKLEGIRERWSPYSESELKAHFYGAVVRDCEYTIPMVVDDLQWLISEVERLRGMLDLDNLVDSLTSNEPMKEGPNLTARQQTEEGYRLMVTVASKTDSESDRNPPGTHD